MSNLRSALRQLAKSPGFTIVALLTLALGIGANTAVFSLVQAVLLRPFPYPNSERLLVLWEDLTLSHFDQASIAWPDLQDWQKQNQTFTAIGGFRRDNFTLTGRGQPERVQGAKVSAAFFDAIGLRPQVGRIFNDAEDRPGAPALAVLMHGCWQNRFGSDPNIVGRTITLDGEPFTVIGVMPREFAHPFNTDFLTQLGRFGANDSWQRRDNHPGIYAIARLKPGVSAEQGFAWFLSFLALISLSLCIMNLLPIPILDGGHLVYYLIESIKGSPVSERALIAGQYAGLVLLAALMGLALFNDVMRRIPF